MKFSPTPPKDIIEAASTGAIDALNEAIARVGAENINNTDHDGCSPLMLASKCDYRDVASRLMKLGAKTELRNNNGSTALHFAVLYNCHEITSELIDHGADVLATNADHASPLAWSFSASRIELFKKMLAKAEPDQSFSVLKNAVVKHIFDQDEDLVRIYLQAGDRFRDHLERLLHRFCERGENSLVGLLLRVGVSPNAEHFLSCFSEPQERLTCLSVAVVKGRVATVRLLLSSVSSFPPPNDNAVKYAIAGGDIEITEELLAHPSLTVRQAVLDETLLRAAQNGLSDAVTPLVIAGADVNSVPSYGHTALIEAVRKGHAEVVRLLLDHGANPKFQPPGQKWNALKHAQKKGLKQIEAMICDVSHHHANPIAVP